MTTIGHLPSSNSQSIRPFVLNTATVAIPLVLGIVGILAVMSVDGLAPISSSWYAWEMSAVLSLALLCSVRKSILSAPSSASTIPPSPPQLHWENFCAAKLPVPKVNQEQIRDIDPLALMFWTEDPEQRKLIQKQIDIFITIKVPAADDKEYFAIEYKETLDYLKSIIFYMNLEEDTPATQKFKKDFIDDLCQAFGQCSPTSNRYAQVMFELLYLKHNKDHLKDIIDKHDMMLRKTLSTVVDEYLASIILDARRFKDGRPRMDPRAKNDSWHYISYAAEQTQGLLPLQLRKDPNYKSHHYETEGRSPEQIALFVKGLCSAETFINFYHLQIASGKIALSLEGVYFYEDVLTKSLRKGESLEQFMDAEYNLNHKAIARVLEELGIIRYNTSTLNK